MKALIIIAGLMFATSFSFAAFTTDQVSTVATEMLAGEKDKKECTKEEKKACCKKKEATKDCSKEKKKACCKKDKDKKEDKK